MKNIPESGIEFMVPISGSCVMGIRFVFDWSVIPWLVYKQKCHLTPSLDDVTWRRHLTLWCQSCVCVNCQMLGCVELSRMSKYSRVKRQQLFCLTTLGAQPVNWLNLRNVCIVQLTRFNDSLRAYRGSETTDSNGTTGEYLSPRYPSVHQHDWLVLITQH